MQPHEITERIKVSPRAIRVNELLSIREEIKRQIDDCYTKLRTLNTELGELLPKKMDKPSCEHCGGDLSFSDITENDTELNVTMFCKKCEPHG